MHRLLPILAAAFSLAAAGCADHDPLLPTGLRTGLTASADARAAAVARPAASRCQTEITFLAPAPGQPPNVQRLVINHTCQIAHLGRTTGTSDQVVTLTPTGSTIANTTTYTAANGDQLFSAFTGTGTLPAASGILGFQGTETYVGGTGRFAGASGTASIVGSASVVTLTGAFEGKGTLSY